MTAKDLKNALLQEAVQGKLVPQIASEGNARDLLEEIKKARHSELVSKSKSKAKKEKPLPEITEDDIPFDIPENWCWCHLGELGLYRKGPFGSSLTKSMFVPKSNDSIKVYEQKNAIQKDYTLGEYYISKNKFETMQSFIVEPSDIIVSCAGTIGEVYKLPNDAPIGIINQALMRVKLFNDNLSAFWMMYFDYVLKKEASKQGAGTAIKNIPPFEILKAYPFPLPPLAEQKRIVAAIEKFMPLIEEYGKKETELKAFNEQIGTLTKKAILQEAVQGKLVPQIAAEGNAKDLLEEIRRSRHSELVSESKSKIKKEKPLPEITEDEIPFDIPENWCWCRLGEIINIKSGDGLTASQMQNGSIPVFGGNGITGYHNIANIHKETIVIGRVGFYCGSVHITPNEAWVTDNAFITSYPEKQIDRLFLVYILRHLNLGQDNNATAQPVVSGKKIYPILFPLPPLAEQKRIVAAIEKMLPLCERLGE